MWLVKHVAAQSLSWYYYGGIFSGTFKGANQGFYAKMIRRIGGDLGGSSGTGTGNVALGKRRRRYYI